MDELTLKNNLETLKHIHTVREGLYAIILELEERIKLHDLSKLQSPEQEIFGKYHELLAQTDYNSEDYTQLLEKVKPAIDHHYSKNRHHPEYHANGVNDMNLVDIMEMLVDWKSSSDRNKNGNLRISIDKNAERFNISPQLKQILINTLKELM